MSKQTPNDCICGERPTILGKAHIAVLCVHCSRSGAGFRTEEEAIADWNLQTAAPDYHEAAEHILTRSEPNDDGTWTVRMNEMVELRTAYAKAEPKP